MIKHFLRSLLFIFLFFLFGANISNAEIIPGLPKLYLNDSELKAELRISSNEVFLTADGYYELGAKLIPINASTYRILIDNKEIRLDMSSGIASIYHIEVSSFMPVAYTVVNFESVNGTLWFSVKDIAPYLGYKYSRINNVDLYRLSDGNETITKDALYEVNTLPPVPPTVPATGPKGEDGKNFSPKKGDKNAANVKKIVYLTFDDGPNQQTPEILALLKKYKMKATFFMLYNGISTEPEMVKQIKADGHGIGLHGVTHRKNLFYKDVTSPLKEMDKANVALEKVLGEKTRLIRTPYGSQPYLSDAQYDQFVNKNYLLWDWNVDSGDSAKAYVSPKIIETRVLTGLKAKAIPVVLLHDKTCTVDSLETILIWMKKNGYISKSLTEDMTPLNWSK